jgi:hypothetical protein
MIFSNLIKKIEDAITVSPQHVAFVTELLGLLDPKLWLSSMQLDYPTATLQDGVRELTT